MKVFEIENLWKRYPGLDKAVNKDINLEVKEGELLGILGGNGAGKTTLIKQLVGIIPPDSGRIRFYGEELNKCMLTLRQKVGYMPQKANALNSLKVKEALYFTAHLRGCSRADARREVDRLLSLWHIEELRNSYCNNLSGGQNRLVRLALSMAGRPQVLILDEPTNDLDPERRKLVWEVLRNINERDGVTIIFITHDAVEAEKIVKRVGVINYGEVVALGNPVELKKCFVDQLRLEICGELKHDTLPFEVDSVQKRNGNLILFFKKENIERIMEYIDFHLIEDFTLGTPTLEDLYFYYAK